jgi:hypothetical protein
VPFLDYIRFTEIKRLIHQVRTELENRGTKSFSVISEYSGEGKTFFVAVLAIGFATLLRRRVLIVDTTTQTQGGNLYLDRIFSSEGGPSGPESRYIDLISPKNAEGRGEESADFDIGPLAELYQDKYDLVIFDTCALSLANKNNIDPVIVSKHAGGAVLVQSRRSMDVDALKSVREQLGTWGIGLVGTVFNAGPAK